MVRKAEPTTGPVAFVKAKIMPLFFFLLAIYTLATLLSSAVSVARTKLELSPTPTTDRCVPFFDTVQDWTKKHSANTETLYDYQASAAIVRICTNETKADVTAAIGNYWYSPFDDGECPLDVGNNKETIIENCLNYSTQLWLVHDRNVTCRNIFDYAPVPYGLFWNHGVYPFTGNVTYEDPQTKHVKEKRAPPCSFKFTSLQYAGGGAIPQCSQSLVAPLRHSSPALSIFLWAVVAVPIIVLIWQCYALYKFTDDVDDGEDDARWLAFALRGIPGAVYNFWWVWFKQEERGPCPHGTLTVGYYSVCIIQDILEGVIAQGVALYGCNFTRFPMPFALLILKIFKIAYDIYVTWIHKPEPDNADQITGQQFPAAGYDPSQEQEQQVTQYTNDAV